MDKNPHDNGFGSSTKSPPDQIKVEETSNKVERVNRFSCTKVEKSCANEAAFVKTRSFSGPPKLEGLSLDGNIKPRRGIMKPSKENVYDDN